MVKMPLRACEPPKKSNLSWDCVCDKDPPRHNKPAVYYKWIWKESTMRFLLCAWSRRYTPAQERERERKIKRRNKVEKEPPRNERKMSERKDGLEHLQDKQMDRRRKWNEREGNNAEHRWVSDTKENRQIRAGRMWNRMRLTHWRPGPAQSKASARWHSCRTSNPEQRPSLPSRCVVWLSSDHPHAGYGNLRDGRDICGLRLLPITYSLSGAWALFLRPTAFTTLFQLLQLMPWFSWWYFQKKVCMSIWTEDFQYIVLNQIRSL